MATRRTAPSTTPQTGAKAAGKRRQIVDDDEDDDHTPAPGIEDHTAPRTEERAPPMAPNPVRARLDGDEDLGTGKGKGGFGARKTLFNIGTDAAAGKGKGKGKPTKGAGKPTGKGNGGGRSGGSGPWVAQPFSMSYNVGYKGGTHRSEKATRGLWIVGDASENKNLRLAVESSFPNAVKVQWIDNEKKYVVTTAPTIAFDLTAQMANVIVECVTTYRVQGAVACPKTVAMINRLIPPFDAREDELKIVDPNPTIQPSVKVWNTNLLQTDEVWLPDGIWVWGDTFSFKQWLRGDPNSGDGLDNQPGYGWCTWNIVTVDPTVEDETLQKPIQTAWWFDSSRTYDLSTYNGPAVVDLAYYLGWRFGIDVTVVPTEHWTEGTNNDDTNATATNA